MYERCSLRSSSSSADLQTLAACLETVQDIMFPILFVVLVQISYQVQILLASPVVVIQRVSVLLELEYLELFMLC